MNKQVLLVLLSAGLLCGVCWAGEPSALKGEDDKISYSVGYQIGGDFKRQNLDIKPEAFLKGMQDALGGAGPLLSRQEMRQILVHLKQRVVAAQQQRRKQLGAKNLAEGKAFLAANAKKEGVKTLPSGLQYKVLEEGSGATPKATDTVIVHYRGILIDGTEFDSSYKRNKPATFRADRVIAGWKEVLQMMPEGAKWQLFIPPNLAYGERGTGRIGPNSTLIFDVELIAVQPAE